MITFCAPTLDNDIPIATIPRFSDNKNSVEWNIARAENPMAPTTSTLMIVFRVPNLVIMKPDAIPNIKIIRAKGDCAFAALNGISSKSNRLRILN